MDLREIITAAVPIDFQFLNPRLILRPLFRK